MLASIFSPVSQTILTIIKTLQDGIVEIWTVFTGMTSTSWVGFWLFWIFALVLLPLAIHFGRRKKENVDEVRTETFSHSPHWETKEKILDPATKLIEEEGQHIESITIQYKVPAQQGA